jgi:hypothetical protein
MSSRLTEKTIAFVYGINVPHSGRRLAAKGGRKFLGMSTPGCGGTLLAGRKSVVRARQSRPRRHAAARS